MLVRRKAQAAAPPRLRRYLAGPVSRRFALRARRESSAPRAGSGTPRRRRGRLCAPPPHSCRSVSRCAPAQVCRYEELGWCHGCCWGLLGSQFGGWEKDRCDGVGAGNAIGIATTARLAICLRAEDKKLRTCPICEPNEFVSAVPIGQMHKKNCNHAKGEHTFPHVQAARIRPRCPFVRFDPRKITKNRPKHSPNTRLNTTKRGMGHQIDNLDRSMLLDKAVNRNGGRKTHVFNLDKDD